MIVALCYYLFWCINREDVSMNKNELISAVASKTGMTQSQAGQALDATLDVITGALKNGDDVRLLGFGNFTVSHRAARMGRNPQTGAPVEIKAANVARFKAGKALKESL